LPEKYLIPGPGIKGLHGGGCGPHPRGEVKGLPEAVGGFLRPEAGGRAEEMPASLPGKEWVRSAHNGDQFPSLTESQFQLPFENPFASARASNRQLCAGRPWKRMEQALRVTDLLLQAGGFSAIVLDMGSIAPGDVLRVPLATWFRYRAAAERSQASIVLLTQHACAKSSAGLLLQFQNGRPREVEQTLFTGIEHRLTVSRERFQAYAQPHEKVITLRKLPQAERSASWPSTTSWAAIR